MAPRSALPYPAKEPVYQITREGGSRPAWSEDGDELFYRFEGRLFGIEIAFENDRPVPGEPRELFEGPAFGLHIQAWDVAADGRFLMLDGLDRSPQPPVTTLHLVLNWFEVLKERVPTGR